MKNKIWFVEKDDRDVSTLYSLADFVDEDDSRIRKNESYEKLVGKLDGILSRRINIQHRLVYQVYES